MQRSRIQYIVIQAQSNSIGHYSRSQSTSGRRNVLVETAAENPWTWELYNGYVVVIAIVVKEVRMP